MRFIKMHGAGNDYVFVDCFAQPIPQNPSELARRIADRHFGVGGDGLVLICPSERADAEMRMYNADGSASEMCGNAIRCVAKYVYDYDIRRRNPLTVETAGRVLTHEMTMRDGRVTTVRVDMGEPILNAEDIPTTLRSAGSAPVVGVPLAIAGRVFAVTCVSMGNPHCVTFVDELTDDWVLRVGPLLEHDPSFPKRVNAEFVQVLNRSEVRQRTWERGTGETLACGSGACAVCVAGVLTGRTDRELVAHLPGGDLRLEWSEINNHVYMTGPAEEVFSGDWPWSSEQS